MVTSRQKDLIGATEVAFRFCATLDDFDAVVQAVIEQAKSGDIKSQQLFLAYMEGLPRRREKRTTAISIGDLDTVTGCGAALETVAHALAAGSITAEDAAAYQSVVSERLRAHQIQLGQEPEPTSGRDIHVHVNGMSGRTPSSN